MGAPRSFAAAMLRAALRLAPEASREWAAAMLRELDFVPGEWAALWWALGSAAAIFQHAARSWRARLTNRNLKEDRMNSTGKKALGFVAGIGAAFALVLCAFGVQELAEYLFPALKIDYRAVTHAITMIILPEVTFVVAAILLWRKRAAVAAGILLFAVTAGLHVIVYLALHHRG